MLKASLGYPRSYFSQILIKSGWLRLRCDSENNFLGTSPNHILLSLIIVQAILCILVISIVSRISHMDFGLKMDGEKWNFESFAVLDDEAVNKELIDTESYTKTDIELAG